MKKSLALILALLLVLSLCACGSAKNGAQSAAVYKTESTANTIMSQAAMDYDMAYETAEYDSGNGFAAASRSAPAVGAAEEELPEENPEKIIYSSDVTVETTDFEETLARLDALVQEAHGWVESSSVNGANYYDSARGNQRTRSASYTLRIPSDRFESLMNSLSGLGNVPYSHTYTENVTARYYDTQARLTAYTAQETRLLEMLDLAKTVEDIIAIEDKLTEVRYEIESLQSSLNNSDRRVNYSTVYLTVNEVREYTPEPEVKITFGDRLWDALLDGFAGAGDFLLVLVSLLPVLLIVAVIVLIVIVFIRRGKERKAAKPAPKAEKSETDAAKE